MKSIRLTKDTRAAILKSIIEGYASNYFKKGSEAELRNRIREEYKQAMSGIWCREYNCIPKSVPIWMISTEAFKVGFEGSSRVEALSMEGKPGKRGAITVILPDESDFQTYDSLRAELATYRKAEKEFKAEVHNLLESINTTKQLVDLWPSAEQYLPAHIADPDKGIKLPALLVSRLDERLGGGS